MRALTAVVVIVTLWVPVAASAATKPPNPCTVITAADAATVLKATPAAAKPKASGSSRICTYKVKRTSLAIETRAVSSLSGFDTSTRSLPAPVFPVSGISNAYSARGGKELALWKNGTEVIITFTGVNPVVQIQATLASQAFANL